MPKIVRINDEDISINGTSYLREITASYHLLVEKLGEPSGSYDNYKTDAEWQIEFEGGLVATIYNWKDGKNYCGDRGLPVEEITEWHIGGYEPRVASWVEDYLYRSWPVFDDIRQDAQF